MSARAKLALALALGLASGCNCDPKVTLARPQLVPPLEVKDFGAVPVLNERVETVDVFNVGRAKLGVSGVRLEETGTPFSIKSAPTEVESGETALIEVAFVPPHEAEYSATLVLETEDEEHPVVKVKLLGRGSTRAVMEVEPPELAFGRVGECSAAVKTFAIRSKGSADLVVNAIRFTDGTSPDFSFVGSTSTPVVVKTLAPNGLPGQIQLTVKYTVPAGSSAPATGGILISGTDPDLREVVIPLSGEPNRAPVPVIAPLGNGAPGMLVSLDGAGSTDPDGDLELRHKWTLRQKPLGSKTQVAGADQATTSMQLDPALPGEYEVELNVTDATGVQNCAPARAKVVATPAQKLLVEMFWNNARTDMDLHVLRTPQAVIGQPPDDCFRWNTTPDWGLAGDPTDDPEFLLDALTGYGPEVLGYVNPIDSTFRIVVEFARENLAPDPASEVTVRVYEFGVVKGEFKKTLQGKGELWNVADVEWPSGIITRVE